MVLGRRALYPDKFFESLGVQRVWRLPGRRLRLGQLRRLRYGRIRGRLMGVRRVGAWRVGDDGWREVGFRAARARRRSARAMMGEIHFGWRRRRFLRCARVTEIWLVRRFGYDRGRCQRAYQRWGGWALGGFGSLHGAFLARFGIGLPGALGFDRFEQGGRSPFDVVEFRWRLFDGFVLCLRWFVDVYRLGRRWQPRWWFRGGLEPGCGRVDGSVRFLLRSWWLVRWHRLRGRGRRLPGRRLGSCRWR